MNAEIKRKWLEVKECLQGCNLTQEVIAEQSEVSQATVSRVLQACPKRYGGGFRKLCIYAETKLAETQESRQGPIHDEDLASAIREVWNGTPEHARALAAMIRAAGIAARVSKN